MPPVMPYVCTTTGDASFYPPLAKKGRTERSVLVHRMIVAPENSIENILQIAIDEIPLESENLVTAIHKIAKIRRNKDSQVETVTDDPRWTRLMQEVVDSGAVFKLQMRPLSLLAWAVSSLRDRRLLPMIFAVATKRTGMGAVPQDLASMAWAVATSRARDQPALLLLDRLAKEAEPRLGEFVPQDMAMCAWAFAKVQARGEGRFLRMLADEALARSAELNGQNVSNIVWSLATVRELHEPLMASVALTRADDIRGLGPQEFSNIVWSFATLPRVSEILFRRTAPCVVRLARDCDSQHLANIAWAYAKVSHRDDGLFHVLSREAMRGVKAVNPLNLANLAWAWASAGHHGEMSTRRMGLRDHEFFEWIAGAAVQCSQAFTPQNCSNLVWGFATLRIGNTALFEHMSDQVTAWLERDFDPQHLSNVLWSYAKLALRDPKSCALFEAAAAEVVRRGVGYLSRSTQNISNTVWAYGALQVGPPAFLHAVSEYLQGGDFYAQLTRTRPLPKSSRAQLAMTVQSLHRLGLTGVAWHLFDRLAADELQASGEAYSNWLFICGDTGDSSREVAVWEHMARVGHTRGVQAAVWNCAVLRSLALGDTRRAALALQAIDAAGLSTPMSEHLRQRAGAPAPRGAVGEVEWRRREKEEHEWVTNPLGFSLRLNKVEYYKEIGTLHYILKHGERLNLPSIHRSIESFTQEQELWLKLAGDEKGAVLDAVIAMHGRPMLVVEVGLYVGYSSTRMASQLRAWGGRIISMEVDPYHAAIARNTIEWAGLTDYIEVWVGHSENLIPRLCQRLPQKSVDILFFDQQGTKMHTDLDVIVRNNMLSDTAIVVGDNVLRPGAPQFMYWTCAAGPWETQVVSLKEYKEATVEDWMSISYYLPRSPAAQRPMSIPEEVEQLAHLTDGIRWQSVEQRVSGEQWDSWSQRMRREFVAVGVKPFEVRPTQDERGHSVVRLRPRGAGELLLAG